LEEVLQYEANPEKHEEKKEDIKQVLNYRKAMLYAMDKLDKVSLTNRLLKEIHKILLTNVRSNTKILGKFRDHQVYIGKQGTSIEDAEFIPPVATEVSEYMTKLENYIHKEEKNPLVQLAIVHAQFEIIHPFGDGNGRVGRMIMPLFLYFKGVLSKPMFYLSSYFERNRDDYYRKLKNITQNNGWNDWIMYFLAAVEEQSKINNDKARSILQLYNNKKEEIRELTHSQYTVDILDFIFSNPFFNSKQFTKQTHIGAQSTANDLISKLQGGDIIKLYEKGFGSTPNTYSFPELLDITG
jgi:Fic family protein